MTISNIPARLARWGGRTLRAGEKRPNGTNGGPLEVLQIGHDFKIRKTLMERTGKT
ncbi:MAG: hypothetical protein ACP5XB_20740 [Isosphaeraceae bacterium]